ncbi:MAG: LuxR C-terminal-related transcriptional regulator [Solibacillus sp.]
MKVIRDLMDAYSEYIELPLILVNAPNNIEYKINGQENLGSFHESAEHLTEMKRISVHLNNPTIISVSDELYISGIFYIITPVFKVSGTQHFLAAGPFREKSITSANQNDTKNDSFSMFSKQQIEDKINKVRKLHQILVNKSLAEMNVSVPIQIMEVLRSLGDLECDIRDYDLYVANLLDQLLKIEEFDFLGLALKNADDMFVIKYIAGKRVEHLVEKRFYIGEGLLGKAVILGEDFYWNKQSDTQRVDFFNRYGIFPEHLFGFVLKQDLNVTGILFGGNFKGKSISESLLNLVKCIVRFVAQRKNMDEKLIDSYYIQTIFANWLDLMDVSLQTDDKKHMAYKVLDFCQILNKELFSCVTTELGDFIYRGEMHKGAIADHQKRLNNATMPPRENIWTDGTYIHFSLPLYGVFTVAFDEHTNLVQAAFILSMVEKLLQQGRAPVSSVAVTDDAVFEMLYSSMEMMNPAQYERADLARQVSTKLAKKFQLPSHVTKALHNICSVLPFKAPYLAKHIAHTNEWKLFSEALKLSDGHFVTENATLETKLLAFIDCVVINNDQKNTLNYLDVETKNTCLAIYQSCVQENLHLHTTVKVEIDHDEIEEIVDLKNVIKTLHLTAREKEILYLILEGLNNQEVGEYLKISVHTVKNHVTNLFKKLNVSDRIQAMTKIYRIKYGEEKL